MPCDELPDNLKTLWKEAGANPSLFTLDQLRSETNRLQAKRRRGHIVLAGALLLVLVGYGLSLFLFPNTLARVGATLSVIVCGYWLVHALVQRARTVPDPGDLDGLRFYRAELEHARDNCRWMSWRWLLLLGPFILFDIGVAQIYAKVWPLIVPFAGFDCGLLLAVFAIWAPVKNLRLARKYQDHINALDAAAGRGQAQGEG
jgi:hypothetical protein